MSAHAVLGEHLYTAEEFYALKDCRNYELWDGHLVERAVSRISAFVGVQTSAALIGFVWPARLGSVYGSDLGLKVFANRPRHVPRADVVFISRQSLDDAIVADTPFLEVVPELLVEVVSPSNTAADIDRKVTEYLDAGVSLVWVIYPATRHAFIHRADGTVELVPPGGVLRGENVIPGFELPLASLFPTP